MTLHLGVLGGTFDPIHLGHLRTAEEIGQQLQLDKVCLIPSASPPHKTSDPVTPFHHRLKMTQLGAEESSLLDVLDLEGKRAGLSYSIETLRELHHIFSPDPELFFILGMDMFLEIKSWNAYRQLFDEAHFVIVRRFGFSSDRIQSFLREIGLQVEKGRQPESYVTQKGKQLFFPQSTTLMDISSTRIRRMVYQKESVCFLVPQPVRHYILKKGLYQRHENSG